MKKHLVIEADSASKLESLMNGINLVTSTEMSYDIHTDRKKWYAFIQVTDYHYRIVKNLLRKNNGE